MTLSSVMFAQWNYNCGWFGVMQDRDKDLWVARMNMTQDSLIVECASTCEILIVPVTVVGTKERRRNTIVLLDVDHYLFSPFTYHVKIPSNSWARLMAKQELSTAEYVVFSPIDKECSCDVLKPPIWN